MKINFVILLVVILLTALMTYGLQRQNLPPSHATAIEDIAPDFSYKTIKGVTGNLYSHKGKVVLLHFWASWCAPCVVEFPDLINLATKQNDNLVILAVAKNDKKTDIERFLKKINKKIPNNFLILNDANNLISETLYSVHKLPETYLISPNHIIAEKIIGPQDNWDTAVWRQKINAYHVP